MSLNAIKSETFLPPAFCKHKTSSSSGEDVSQNSEKERMVCAVGIDCHLELGITVREKGCTEPRRKPINLRHSSSACPSMYTGKRVPEDRHAALSSDPIALGLEIEKENPYDGPLYAKMDPRLVSKTVVVRDYSCKVPIDLASVQNVAEAVLNHFPDQYVQFLRKFVSNLFGSNMILFLERKRDAFQRLMDKPDELNRVSWGAYARVKGKQGFHDITLGPEDDSITRALQKASVDGKPISSQMSPADVFDLKPCLKQHIHTLDTMIDGCKGFATSEEHVLAMLYFANEQGRNLCDDLMLMKESDLPDYSQIRLQVPDNVYKNGTKETSDISEAELNTFVRRGLVEGKRTVHFAHTQRFSVGNWMGNADASFSLISDRQQAPYTWGWGHPFNLVEQMEGTKRSDDGASTENGYALLAPHLKYNLSKENEVFMSETASHPGISFVEGGKWGSNVKEAKFTPSKTNVRTNVRHVLLGMDEEESAPQLYKGSESDKYRSATTDAVSADQASLTDLTRMSDAEKDKMLTAMPLAFVQNLVTSYGMKPGATQNENITLIKDRLKHECEQIPKYEPSLSYSVMRTSPSGITIVREDLIRGCLEADPYLHGSFQTKNGIHFKFGMFSGLRISDIVKSSQYSKNADLIRREYAPMGGKWPLRFVVPFQIIGRDDPKRFLKHGQTTVPPIFERNDVDTPNGWKLLTFKDRQNMDDVTTDFRFGGLGLTEVERLGCQIVAIRSVLQYSFGMEVAALVMDWNSFKAKLYTTRSLRDVVSGNVEAKYNNLYTAHRPASNEFKNFIESAYTKDGSLIVSILNMFPDPKSEIVKHAIKKYAENSTETDPEFYMPRYSIRLMKAYIGFIKTKLSALISNSKSEEQNPGKGTMAGVSGSSSNMDSVDSVNINPTAFATPPNSDDIPHFQVVKGSVPDPATNPEIIPYFFTASKASYFKQLEKNKPEYGDNADSFREFVKDEFKRVYAMEGVSAILGSWMANAGKITTDDPYRGVPEQSYRGTNLADLLNDATNPDRAKAIAAALDLFYNIQSGTLDKNSLKGPSELLYTILKGDDNDTEDNVKRSLTSLEASSGITTPLTTIQMDTLSRAVYQEFQKLDAIQEARKEIAKKAAEEGINAATATLTPVTPPWTPPATESVQNKIWYESSVISTVPESGTTAKDHSYPFLPNNNGLHPSSRPEAHVLHGKMRFLRVHKSGPSALTNSTSKYNSCVHRQQLFSMLDASGYLWNARSFYNPADSNRPDTGGCMDSDQVDDMHYWCRIFVESFVASRETYESKYPSSNVPWEQKVKTDPFDAFSQEGIGAFSEDTFRRLFPLLPPSHGLRDKLRAIRALDVLWGTLPSYSKDGETADTRTGAWMPLAPSLQARLYQSVGLYDDAHRVPLNPWHSHGGRGGIGQVFFQSYHSPYFTDSWKCAHFKDWLVSTCKYQRPSTAETCYYPFSQYGGTPVMADFVHHRVEDGQVNGKDDDRHNQIVYNRFGFTSPLRLGQQFRDTGLLQDMYNFRYRAHALLSPEQREHMRLIGRADSVHISNFMSYARVHSIIALASCNHGTEDLSEQRAVRNLYRLYVDTYVCMGANPDDDSVPAVMGFAPSPINSSNDRPVTFYAGGMSCLNAKMEAFCNSDRNGGEKVCKLYKQIYLNDAAILYSRLQKAQRKKVLHDANFQRAQIKRGMNYSREEFNLELIDLQDTYIDFLQTTILGMLIENGADLHGVPLNLLEPRELQVSLMEEDDDVVGNDYMTPRTSEIVKELDFTNDKLDRRQLAILSLVPPNNRLLGTMRLAQPHTVIDMEHVRKQIQKETIESNKGVWKRYLDALISGAFAEKLLEFEGPVDPSFDLSEFKDPVREAEKVAKRYSSNVTAQRSSSVSQKVRAEQMRTRQPRNMQTLYDMNKNEFQQALKDVQRRVDEDYSKMKRTNPGITKGMILERMDHVPDYVKDLLRQKY